MATDEALYAQVRDGDRSALAELISRYHASLYRFLYRMTGDEQAAEDFVQDTFVRIMTHEGTAPQRFKPWIFTVARNLAYDTFRSAAYRREASLGPDDGTWLSTSRPGVERVAQRHADQRAIADVIQELQPHHREVLVLRFYHDLSLKEIAEVVDCPVGTVKSRLHHALKKAKLYLELQEVVCER